MIEERNQSSTFGLFARDLIENGRSFRFCARGKSMSPTIRDGDTLQVEPITRAPRIGDIVLFVRKGQFTAHRVVGRRDGNLITRGDASMEADGVVRSEEMLGRVVAKTCARNGHTLRINCTREKLLFLGRKLRGTISRFVRASIAGSCAAAILMLVPISLRGQGGVRWHSASRPRHGELCQLLFPELYNVQHHRHQPRMPESSENCAGESPDGQEVSSRISP